MKRTIVRAVNSVLSPLGARVVRTGHQTMDEALAMPAAVARVREHGLPVASVIDVGASNGSWSLATMRVFPDAAFLAVEPLRERAAELETIKASIPRFDFASCVAGEEDGGTVTMAVTDDLNGSTVDGVGGESRTVPVRSIDALVREKGLRGPFLLKLDTHGFELPILAGATETLRESSVVIMEVYAFQITPHALRFHEMCSHMEGLGFRCYDIADPLLRTHDKALWQMDLLFARADAPVFEYSEYA